MDKTIGGKWWKYSPEFKNSAVERMQGGPGVTALARELGIHRKLLYKWRDMGYGKEAMPERKGAKAKTPSAKEGESREITQLKKRIAELERLAGKQAGELDFFVAALRSVEELRRSKSNSSGAESTQPLKPQRKAQAKQSTRSSTS